MGFTRAAPARPTSSWTWPMSRRSAPLTGAKSAAGRAAGMAPRLGDAFFAALRDVPAFLTFLTCLTFSTGRFDALRLASFRVDFLTIDSSRHELDVDANTEGKRGARTAAIVGLARDTFSEESHATLCLQCGHAVARGLCQAGHDVGGLSKLQHKDRLGICPGLGALVLRRAGSPPRWRRELG